MRGFSPEDESSSAHPCGRADAIESVSISVDLDYVMKRPIVHEMQAPDRYC